MNNTIVHVHLIAAIGGFKAHSDHYFGSIAAIFSVFTEDELGFTETYLRHAKLGVVINKKAIVKRGEVITSPRRKNSVESGQSSLVNKGK